MHREEEAAAAGPGPRPGAGGNNASLPDPGELTGRPAGGLQRGNRLPRPPPGPLALAPPASAPGGVLLCPVFTGTPGRPPTEP